MNKERMKDSKDKINVCAKVSRATYQQIVECCTQRELGISDIVREALRDYLAKQKAI